MQAHSDRVGKAEEHAGRRGVKRIVAAEHDRDDGDPAAPRAHVFGEDADRAKRELRPGKTRERPCNEHCDDTVAANVDAERAGRLRLLADATQPQSDRREEHDHADQRGERPGRPRYGRLAGEGPAKNRQAYQRRNRDPPKADHAGIAEGSADAEDDPQEVRSQSEASRFMPMPMTTGSPRKTVAP